MIKFTIYVKRKITGLHLIQSQQSRMCTLIINLFYTIIPDQSCMFKFFYSRQAYANVHRETQQVLWLHDTFHHEKQGVSLRETIVINK